MSDNLSTETNNSAVINEIGFYIYEAILTIQQQQPEILVEKYRDIPWQDARYQSAFLVKLKQELGKTQDTKLLITRLEKVLQVLLIPKFFKSADFKELTAKVSLMIGQSATASSAEASHSQSAEEYLHPKKLSAGIAILLLDVENLQLSIETERFLAEVCTHPIQIKIAFANWRNMGKQDIEFHGRGYELIHVPAGKDSADVKMATVGSSIFVHYPNAREILVCSSDRVLSHLCNTLQTHGLTVYQVRKLAETITIINSKTGEILTHTFKPSPEIPSLDELITQLKELIKIEQKRTDSSWLKLSRISNLFYAKYQLTLRQVVATYLPGKKVRDIFIEYPSEFAVHQLSNQSQVYVTLFELPKVKNSSQSLEIKPYILSSLESKEDLEQALINLLNALTIKSPGSYILLQTLGSEFHKQYGQPITQLITDLQVGTNFLKFLQSCSAFKLEKTAKTYQVALKLDLSQNSAAP